MQRLNAFFALVFTAWVNPQESLTLEIKEKAWRKEDFPLVKEDQVRDQLNEHKFMGCEYRI